MIMPTNPFQVRNEAEILSPSLLVYPDRIFRNLERMLQIGINCRKWSACKSARGSENSSARRLPNAK